MSNEELQKAAKYERPVSSRLPNDGSSRQRSATEKKNDRPDSLTCGLWVLARKVACFLSVPVDCMDRIPYGFVLYFLCFRFITTPVVPINCLFSI